MCGCCGEKGGACMRVHESILHWNIINNMCVCARAGRCMCRGVGRGGGGGCARACRRVYTVQASVCCGDADGCMPLTMLVDVCHRCRLLTFIRWPLFETLSLLENLVNKESESDPIFFFFFFFFGGGGGGGFKQTRWRFVQSVFPVVV